MRLKKLSFVLAGSGGLMLLSACNGGGSAANANAGNSNVSNHSLASAKVTTTPTNEASFDYIAPFKDYNNKIILKTNGLTVAKNLEFTTNFTPKDGWGECFGVARYSLSFNTVSTNGKYITTVTPTDAALMLDLSKSCDIMGTDGATVLTGVADPIVYGVTVTQQDNTQIALSMYQPCAATECKDPGNGYVNAGYYAQWSVWNRQYNPYTMPFNNINDIIYGFIGFDPATGNIMSLDAQADSWGLSAASRAMQQYPYMKAHLSFGGWTNNSVNTAPMFEQLASSPASMQNFANQAVDLMRKTGFSGIDIDWEWWSDYGVNEAPAQKQLAFFQILRTTINTASVADGKHYTLTIATSIGKDKIEAMSASDNPNSVPNFWSQVNGLVDHINVMSYDMHGAYDKDGPAYFQAPWSMNSDNPYLSTGYDIKTGINTYVNNGVPANKLVAGVPLYGRSMAISSLGDKAGLYSNVTGVGFGDYEEGIMDYKCIINPVNDPVNGCGSDKPVAALQNIQFVNQANDYNGLWTQYSKNTSYEPWAYNDNTFISYDDVYSATMKTRAAKEMGLGGMMTWELDGDTTDPKTSLVQAIKNELNS